jgi:hypothetical protein
MTIIHKNTKYKYKNPHNERIPLLAAGGEHESNIEDDVDSASFVFIFII